MKFTKLAICTTVGVIAASTTPAIAAPFLFSLTGTKTASFVLDSNPLPDTFSSSALIGDQIGFNSVAGTFGGVPGFANVSFGTNLLASLNIGSADLGFTQLSGPALFSGPASNPVFSTGSFVLTNPFFGDRVTLQISAAAQAVPEPTAWSFMILGFGLAGLTLRYRRPTLSFTYG